MISLVGVLDANMVIRLSQGQVFHLLPHLYDRLLIPAAVTKQVVTGAGRDGESELLQALGVWLTEVTPDPTQVQQLSVLRSWADREVLATASQHSAVANEELHILSADKQIRWVAANLGMQCLSIPDVVVRLKRRGLIPSAKAVLDLVIQHGYRIRPAIYDDALRLAGEFP